MREFPALFVQCIGLFLPPVLVRIPKASLHQIHLFLEANMSIGAVIEEVPALVTDPSESCRGDALVRSVADSPLFSLLEPPHHLSQGWDFDRFPSVGSGSEVDVSLLCQTECLVLSCC